MMDPLHKLACECCKQDIAEVEMVIAILTPILEEWWLEVIEDAMRQGRLIIESQPRPQIAALDLTARGKSSQEVEDEIVAAFEAVLLRRIYAMPVEIVAAVEQARDSLLTDAFLLAGVTGTRRQLLAHAGRLEAGLGPLRAASLQDLATLMAGRVQTRLPEVRAAVRAWSRAHRSPRIGAGAAQAAAATLKARVALEAILGVQDVRRWVTFAVDQWGYRWFVIWNVLDDLETGTLFFHAKAVRDHRTTRFCRWVDGRLISAAKVRDQIKNHARASLRGDIDALMGNWPLLGSEITDFEGAGEDILFGRSFTTVAMPPYHGRCRTILVPVSIEENQAIGG